MVGCCGWLLWSMAGWSAGWLVCSGGSGWFWWLICAAVVGIVLGGWLLWLVVRDGEMMKTYPVDTVQAGQLVGRVVGERERYFDWYGSESTSELAVWSGVEIRLVVDNVNRRVLRAGYVGQFCGSVDLSNVPGLVCRFYGAATYGHREWFVDQLVTCYGDWSAAVPVGDLIG